MQDFPRKTVTSSYQKTFKSPRFQTFQWRQYFSQLSLSRNETGLADPFYF